MSSAELASFSVLVSGFAQLRLVFGVEVSRLSSCFKLWFSWRMRSYSSLNAERWTKNSLSDAAAIGWVYFGGGYGPPPPPQAGTWKLRSNQEFDRFAVVFCWYFFCLLVAVINKKHCRYRLVTQFVLFVHISLGNQKKTDVWYVPSNSCCCDICLEIGIRIYIYIRMLYWYQSSERSHSAWTLRKNISHWKGPQSWNSLKGEWHIGSS